MQNNTSNYNNHHGDYFLTMSLRINTENAKYAWCAVKRHKSYWSTVTVYKPFRYMYNCKFVFLQGLK
jgi:hypothetical protein